MKLLVTFLGVLVLLVVAGCASDHSRAPTGPAGGTSDYPETGFGHGQGEFLGYPDYPDYRDVPSHRNNP
ncbi:MAG TPA: hypothetical protein VNT26_11640 [Candidatus Sulfotelmatobacter sp.]|nr:hypothetical protein [Candidatus Sulfotelmatobacter sp.]HWI58082.1 hypothetical protein [Bacillota bacterium]